MGASALAGTAQLPCHGHRCIVSQGGTPWVAITRLCCPSNGAFCPQAGPSGGPRHRVCIIDEIGKMELFSQPFIQAVRQTLSTPGTVVLGTIPVPKGKPLALVEEIRNRRDVKVFSVTKENRNSLLPDIVTCVQSSRT
ncbi:cancer-related nucleoside-triphosphatase [Peromyscus eremicus]|uniref:cancer-related nucleoside-triphosphatase n=1 Tax=Peromyscus eremicus TaxID=42410 RepID=UPI0027DC8F07|nr:cancer-related nucleoside-triphosphatase [Peromyscus eremicus]